MSGTRIPGETRQWMSKSAKHKGRGTSRVGAEKDWFFLAECVRARMEVATHEFVLIPCPFPSWFFTAIGEEMNKNIINPLSSEEETLHAANRSITTQ